MLIDLIHWLSSLHPEQWLALAAALLMVDTPRYALSKLAMVAWDCGAEVWERTPLSRRRFGAERFTFCPSVCAILVSHNEEATLVSTLRSIVGTYPRLEVIVVDDGSTDGTAAAAERYVREHPSVRLLRKPRRDGKASSYNFALRYTKAQVIVVMDCDTEAGAHAIWEAVQSLRDPRVGAVSCAVLVGNAFDNLLTWLQGFEYLHSIFVGRMVNARLGILGVVSGAFGAFRRAALVGVGGCDIGPGDDSDMTLRIRKAGYRVAFAPYAQCFTKAPRTLGHLFRQRRRWSRGAIRYKCRKHIDMADLRRPGFIAANFFLLANVWVFNILLLYTFWFYFVWTCFHFEIDVLRLFAVTYGFYLLFHLAQAGSILFYSTNRWRDAAICLAIPFTPFYQWFMKLIRLLAVTEEMLLRVSYEDPFYPPHVREATWKW